MKKLWLFLLLMLIAPLAHAANPSFLSFKTNNFRVHEPYIDLKYHVTTPQDFGAVGDGFTDDAPAIQRAFDYSGTNGHTVYFPTASYYVGTRLTITNPVSIFSDGLTGRWEDGADTNDLVGAELVYGGDPTQAMIECSGRRLYMRDIRLRSLNTNAFGLKLVPKPGPNPPEEWYIDHVLFGGFNTKAVGFGTGFYAENASIGSLENCIFSGNSTNSIWLDCQTGASSDVTIISPHFYASPMGLHGGVNGSLHVIAGRAESTKAAFWFDNNSPQNGNLQGVTIDGFRYLNSPAAAPLFYSEGRFMVITNSSGGPMQIWGMRIQNCQVANLSATYDIEGIFGGIAPSTAAVEISHNSFIGSTNAVFHSDSPSFTTLAHDNFYPTAQKFALNLGETPMTPMVIQGQAASIEVGARNQESILRLISGAHSGYPTFIQAGTNITDGSAEIDISRIDSGTMRLSRLKQYADVTEVHGELQVARTNDVLGLRFLSDPAGDYIQPGTSSTDTNANLRLTRRDTATGYMSSLEAYSTNTIFYGRELNISDQPGGAGFRFLPNTGNTHYLQVGTNALDGSAHLVLSRMLSSGNFDEFDVNANLSQFAGPVTVLNAAPSLTLHTTGGGIGNSSLTFTDNVIGSARASVGIPNGDTNLVIAANTGEVSTISDNGAVWYYGTNIIAKIAKNSGYTGSGTNVLNDAGFYVPQGTVSSTNVAWGAITGTITNQSEFSALSTDHLPLFNGTGFSNGGLVESDQYAGSVAIGNHAYTNNATLLANVAIGASALTLVTTNANNVAIGQGALGQATAEANTAIGQFAGHNLTTGGNNVVIGRNAAAFSVGGTSSHNIIIGSLAQNRAGTITNAIAIGDSTSVTNSNEIVLGNTSNTKLIVPIASWTGTGNNFYSDDGTFKAATGGANVCVGTSTNYLLYYNGTCITNSLASVTTNGIYVPEINTPSLVVSNLSDGVIIGQSNTLTNIPPTNGYLHYDGTNYGWSASPVTVTSGLTNFASGSDYSLTDSAADVVFGAATLQTPALTAGTYLITVSVQYLQYRSTGQQCHIKLYNTELGADVARSERWTGPDVNTANFAGEWPITFQTTVPVSSSAQFKVMGWNAVAGDTNSQIRSGASTISWIKIN